MLPSAARGQPRGPGATPTTGQMPGQAEGRRPPSNALPTGTPAKSSPRARLDTSSVTLAKGETMRFASLVLLLIAIVAPAVWAVPVDPSAPDGIAALFAGDGGGLWILRTNGEVWRLGETSTVWERTTNFRNDVPLPVEQIVDWMPYFLTRVNGERWWLNSIDHTWGLMPAPPFAPVSAQQKSFGSVKQLFK